MLVCSAAYTFFTLVNVKKDCRQDDLNHYHKLYSGSLGLCDNREKSIIVKSHYRYRENFIIVLL